MTKPRIMADKGKFYSKEEIIKEVRKGSKVGKLIIKAEMEFLKACATGEIYDQAKS